jgi:hypothetical protein
MTDATSGEGGRDDFETRSEKKGEKYEKKKKEEDGKMERNRAKYMHNRGK